MGCLPGFFLTALLHRSDFPAQESWEGQKPWAVSAAGLTHEAPSHSSKAHLQQAERRGGTAKRRDPTLLWLGAKQAGANQAGP